MLALLYQDESGPSVRATLAWLYLVASVIMLVALWSAGRIGQTGLLLSAGLVTRLAAGLRAVAPSGELSGPERTRAVIPAMAGISALLLLVRAAIDLAAA